jgi:hypothetical protein
MKPRHCDLHLTNGICSATLDHARYTGEPWGGELEPYATFGHIICELVVLVVGGRGEKEDGCPTTAGSGEKCGREWWNRVVWGGFVGYHHVSHIRGRRTHRS